MLQHFCISRGLATGIYTTNSPEACMYVAANCEANIVVVENQAQLSKILQVRCSTGQRVHSNMSSQTESGIDADHAMSTLSFLTSGEGSAASPESHCPVQRAATAEGIVPVFSTSSQSTRQLVCKKNVTLLDLLCLSAVVRFPEDGRGHDRPGAERCDRQSSGQRVLHPHLYLWNHWEPQRSHVEPWQCEHRPTTVMF